MKIIKNAPEVPRPPVESRHDCGDRIRGWEMRGLDSYRRFGMVVECSCGARYELRALTFWVRSVYSATQYWSRCPVVTEPAQAADVARQSEEA